MATIKQAVANAMDFANETLGIVEAQLEELSSDARHFQVTLSFPKRIASGESYIAAYR